MPMDYDDKDFHIHNVHLAGEGSSTVSSVLRPYALPKFDYDDSLQGHLRFDSLVENEVFLGITDNQWIEEYSRGSSGIEFSSSAAEPRHNNVWSEATSSESVEILLKSVGQEERVLGETITEEMDAGDQPGSLDTMMDPNLKQDDGNNHAPKAIVTNNPLDNYSGSSGSIDRDKSHATFTTQSEEAKTPGRELDSVVLGKKCDLYVEKVDKICDVNKEVGNLAVELFEYEQDLSTSKVECGDTGSLQNVDASKGSTFTKNSSNNEAEYSIKNEETSMDNQKGSYTAVETSIYSDEKPPFLSNTESLDDPSSEASIHVNEESTSLTEECKAHVLSSEHCHGSKCAATASPVGSEVQEVEDSMHGDSLAGPPVIASVELQKVEDNNTESGILASPESIVSSPSKVPDVQSHSVEETEDTNGKGAQQATPDAFEVSVGSDASEMRQGNNITELVAGSILNEDLVVSNDTHSEDIKDKETAELSGSLQVKDETRSPKQSSLCVDQDVNANEGGDARLPLDCGDMTIHIVGALESENNVESSSSAESCKKAVMAQGSEAAMTILAESVTPAVKSSSADGDYLHSGSVATNSTASKLPLCGMSSVHQGNEKEGEAGFLSEEKESLKVASRVDSASEESLCVVEKDASPDCVGKIVHGVAGHCASPVEKINDIISEQAQEASSDSLGCSTTMMMNPLPCDPSAKVGANVEAGGVQVPKESMSGHHVAPPLSSAVNKSAEQQDVEGDARHDEDCSVSLDKFQSVSPSTTSNTEPSQIAEVTHGTAMGAIDENVSLPQVTEGVDEKVQSVSLNRDINRDESITFEVSGQTGKGQLTFPAIQACNLSMNMEGSSTKKPDEVPQTPSKVGAKGNSERKTRRKSVGKESAKKGDNLTPRQSGIVEKSSATGHVIQFEELKPKEVTKPLPTSRSTLPDLNNATSIFQQPFTDNQQVELRAQILVYGSLISGTPPEEPHMVAAFGQSDGGRKTWEAAWRACLERVHNRKNQTNNPMQSRSDLKDIGHTTPDPGSKHSPLPSKPSNKGVSPLIPLSSPLWNMTTPPRSGLLDYRQSFSPLHPYQTPNHPAWLSQGPFAGQWPVSTFNAGTCFSALPITEAVKLTPVNLPGGSGIKQTYPIPMLHAASGQASSDSKSRKRKKATDAVTAPPAVHLHPVLGTEGHSHIPLLLGKPTDSVIAPVVSSIFSTSVTVSAPASMTSKSTPGWFLSMTHDRPGFEDKKVENVIISEDKAQGCKVQAEDAGQPSSDSKSMKRKKVTTSPVAAPVFGTEQISLLAPNQTNSFPTSTPVSITSNNSPGRLHNALYSASTHGYPRNMKNAEETLSKIEESKLQAENAALLAAAEVSQCQDVWSRLESQRSSDGEAKLMSSAASIAAAATVAKMAAAAAKIASDVAEQARLMADEVFLSSKTENDGQSSIISHPATPVSMMKKRNHPNSIISVAREAARRRIEAASAASKHAENLDAIVKAAELAAEAVSQAGKIVAMGDPSALRKLVETGPEGYWKASPSAYDQQREVSGHLNDKKKAESASTVSIKEIQTSKQQEDTENQVMVVDGPSGNKKEIRVRRTHRGPNVSKDAGYVVGHQSISGAWEQHNIKEGCLVEVYKEEGKYKGAWLAANVLSLKGEKALVCYCEIQSPDEGSEKLKEWVALETEGSEVPIIRIAHPVTTMRFEGSSKKRRRTAVTDYAWSNGDRVDVWMQDCWRVGVVTEANKIDATSLAVQFPAQGERCVVRSWNVRPTLIWKDGKWMEWSSVKFESETPKEKRMKLGMKDNEESGTLALSAQERCFDVGGDEKKVKKEGARVIFGVPKPGRKQKFMDVSKHYVADAAARYLKPQPSKSRKSPLASFTTLGHKADDKSEVGSEEDALAALKKPFTFTSRPKQTPAFSIPEASEPRRSNRKIQPTSRLLEGIQTSLTISKIHASQRRHNKKEDANHG